MTVSSWRALYAGGLLLACLVLGGGTQRGLATVVALELLALPLVLDVLVGRGAGETLRWPVHGVVALLAAAFVVQFLPGWLVGGSGALVSRDPGRTLDALLFVCFALTLFYSFARLDEMQRGRLIAWFLTGVILNIVLALTQFAASRALEIQFFPYTLLAGFFANQNHFSSLLYVAMPFVIYQFDAVGRLPWAALVVAIIVFVEFAAGSTAGILLSLASALVSVAMVARTAPRLRATLLGLAVLGAIVLALNPGSALKIDVGDPLERPQIALGTLRLIPTTLPFGSGFGTFDIVYPAGESDADIGSKFVNHAHNEILELILEGGLPAAAAIIGYLALLAWYFPLASRSPLRMAALCSIAFLLVHCLVDYPLRTVAMVASFALFNAIYFSQPEKFSTVGINATQHAIRMPQPARHPPRES